jgi:hypothetical protein
MPVISGEVNNAKVDVLMAVTKACEEAKATGGWHPGPVSRALNRLIDSVLARGRAPQEKKPTTPRCTSCGSTRLGYDSGEVPGQGVDYCEACGMAQIPESFYRIRDLEAEIAQLRAGLATFTKAEIQTGLLLCERANKDLRWWLDQQPDSHAELARGRAPETPEETP